MGTHGGIMHMFGMTIALTLIVAGIRKVDCQNSSVEADEIRDPPILSHNVTTMTSSEDGAKSDYTKKRNTLVRNIKSTLYKVPGLSYFMSPMGRKSPETKNRVMSSMATRPFQIFRHQNSSLNESSKKKKRKAKIERRRRRKKTKRIRKRARKKQREHRLRMKNKALRKKARNDVTFSKSFIPFPSKESVFRMLKKVNSLQMVMPSLTLMEKSTPGYPHTLSTKLPPPLSLPLPTLASLILPKAHSKSAEDQSIKRLPHSKADRPALLELPSLPALDLTKSSPNLTMPSSKLTLPLPELIIPSSNLTLPSSNLTLPLSNIPPPSLNLTPLLSLAPQPLNVSFPSLNVPSQPLNLTPSPLLTLPPLNLPSQTLNLPSQPLNRPSQPSNLPSSPLNLPSQPLNLTPSPLLTLPHLNLPSLPLNLTPPPLLTLASLKNNTLQSSILTRKTLNLPLKHLDTTLKSTTVKHFRAPQNIASTEETKASNRMSSELTTKIFVTLSPKGKPSTTTEAGMLSWLFSGFAQSASKTSSPPPSTSAPIVRNLYSSLSTEKYSPKTTENQREDFTTWSKATKPKRSQILLSTLTTTTTPTESTSNSFTKPHTIFVTQASSAPLSTTPPTLESSSDSTVAMVSTTDAVDGSGVERLTAMFENSLHGNQDVLMPQYVTAYTNLTNTFVQFGVVLEMASSDILSKLDDLRVLNRKDKENYSTFGIMFKYEFSTGLALDGKQESGVRQNKIIHRGLKLFLEILRELSKGDNDKRSLATRMLVHYNAILAPHHSTWVRFAARMALRVFPSRASVMATMKATNDAKGWKQMADLTTAVETVFTRIDAMYFKYYGKRL